jgi:hypothetical protein
MSLLKGYWRASIKKFGTAQRIGKPLRNPERSPNAMKKLVGCWEAVTVWIGILRAVIEFSLGAP